MPRYVLGVNPGYHDGSAALLRDGELVAMVEQERMSRRRRAPQESPSLAVGACLAHAGIDLDAVAEIAIGWDVPLWEGLGGTTPFEGEELGPWLVGDLRVPGQPIPPLRYVDHHLAHAASAFYTSGMSEAAILVVDGRGELAATSLAAGGPGGIETVRTWGAHMSLGHLYGTASQWAGFGIWGGGKLMGLASYGRPRQPVPLAASESDGYTIDDAPPADLPLSSQLQRLSDGLLDRFRERNYPFCPGDPDDVMAHANFAASVQSALEAALMSLARLARKETGLSNLVLAGGVALNCSANGELIRSRLFDEIWVPPFPHDAGVSLGAALAVDRASRQEAAPARLRHAFWAPDVVESVDDAAEKLAGCELSRHSGTELAEVVAEHLAGGKLVGWWQGRAEVGQRALGARSILCDPRERRALLRANRVKGRENWRPLAPAVLHDRTEAVFEGALPTAADFMLAAWPVREGARPLLPAAVHVDGSARPQVVRPAQSRYHDLIRAFDDRTGVPAVINTSFNLAGEPIVLSAADAVSTFLRSEVDVLVLDNLVAVKPRSDC